MHIGGPDVEWNPVSWGKHKEYQDDCASCRDLRYACGVEGSQGTKDTNPKDAVGATKPGLDALPFGPLMEAALAHWEGALKYGKHNWRAAGVRHSIYIAAAMRHLMAFWEGQDEDPSSGVSHLGHVVACCLIVRDCQFAGTDYDDRPLQNEEWQKWREHLDEKFKALLEAHPDPLSPYLEQDGGTSGGQR